MVARVSYSYNSNFEAAGLPGYFLDAYVSRGGDVVVDVHQVYETRAQFYEAIEEIIPILNDEQIDQEFEGVEASLRQGKELV